MAIIAGVDPGVSGAIALYCTDSKRVISVTDMPNWSETVGKKARTRIDTIALMEMFDTLNLMSVEMVVLEAVGGRPKQSASAGFVFGYTVGLIYMAAMYSKIMVETVPPKEWKKIMKIPGKAGGKTKEEKKQATGDIMRRVSEIFPNERHMFQGPKGGYYMDRADAALLAKFGGDFVYPTMGPLTNKSDQELKLAYRNADTGA